MGWHASAPLCHLEGNTLILQALLEAGGPVDRRNDQGHTALHEAAMVGHSNVIRVLLGHNADIEAVDISGLTALHWAAVEGHVDALRTLCQKGASIKANPSTPERTVLHFAAQNGRVAVVRELFNLGANIEATKRYGRRPLDIAIMWGEEDAQAVLRELGAKTSSELSAGEPSDS